MDVFAYGTLTQPDRVASVVDSFVFVGAAVLEGCHPVDGRYPTLAPGGETAGRLLRTDDIDALDAYEGIGQGLYVRVSAPRTDGGTAVVYVGDPAALDGVAHRSEHARDDDGDVSARSLTNQAAVEWPGEGTFAERVEQYFDSSVVVRPLPA
ncbi:gamma-glutamylcyclotransferase family protein [Haloplanus halobius]|uniref:gamma-glutamylcyclotransferase family protein n=1 Tax=Haloplanus halobius TaxID=2934938 RepID=UPI0020107613|nr:gamma-glutamylcyclotransferase family protein [Haloplanus sp. XH21]